MSKLSADSDPLSRAGDFVGPEGTDLGSEPHEARRDGSTLCAMSESIASNCRMGAG